MKKKEDIFCPITFTMSLLNGKWKVAILYKLMEGTKRFKELEREVTGITPKMLIHELKELEEKKIITRKQYPEIPPKVEYALTESGHSLRNVVEFIHVWGAQHLVHLGHSKEEFKDLQKQTE